MDNSTLIVIIVSLSVLFTIPLAAFLFAQVQSGKDKPNRISKLYAKITSHKGACDIIETLLFMPIVFVALSPVAAFIGWFFSFIQVACGRDWLEDVSYWQYALDGYTMLFVLMLIAMIVSALTSHDDD